MPAIRANHFKSLLQDLTCRGELDKASVNKALDAALQDGRIDPNERALLTQLLDEVGFDTQDTRQSLAAFLSMPDPAFLALAYKLQRDDGRIEVNDMQALKQLVQQGGVSKDQRVSLYALQFASKMSPAAQSELEPLLSTKSATVRALDAAELKRLNAAPLRTYTLTSGVATLVDPAALAKMTPPSPGQLKSYDSSQLNNALQDAHIRRQHRLQNPTAALDAQSRVCPEDGSVRVRNFHMSDGGMALHEYVFPQQIAQIGQVEGFNVVLRSSHDNADYVRTDFRDLGLDNVVVVAATGEGDFWSEDQGEIDTAGNVRVPAPRIEPGNMTTATMRERILRLYPDTQNHSIDAVIDDPDKLAKSFPKAAFDQVGAVAMRSAHEIMAGVAVAKGSQLNACLSHIEGGNLLVGTLSNGDGYAIVGRDSVSATHAALREDLGRELAEDEVLQIIGADLGVPASNIYPVEQPDDFHIDMWMLPIKPGEVIVNDARSAAQLLIENLTMERAAQRPKQLGPNASSAEWQRNQRELQAWQKQGPGFEDFCVQIEQNTEKRAKAIQGMAADLEKAGLKVHYAPGVLEVPGSQVMNFLNAEQGTNAKGERYYIALGGAPHVEKVFVERLAQIAGDTISRVHLLDRQYTKGTLQALGGISCRCKIEGELV